MKKYAILREFFPWNLFAPPISEKFLAMSVPHMKPPKSLWRDKELDVTAHEIESYDGQKLTCFLMSPKGLPEKAPCLIYLHGGGFVLEAAGYHYANAMRYAKEVGCKVVFPLYRLAPQHPFPAFFEDCYAAFGWANDHAEELGIDIDHMGIGGDSAGSTLAVGVCLMARERNHPVKFRFQMLPYPFLDARNESESCKRFTDTPMWNSSLSDRIGPMTKVEKNHPNYIWYSPVEAESFEGLPPAYIETAEFDCLHDDGILYADLLKKAGVAVTLNETKGTMHGFDIATKAPTTLAAMEQRIAFMKRMLEDIPNFPAALDNAKVLFYTPYGDYGAIRYPDGETADDYRYLAICRYPEDNTCYLFCCNESYEVVSDWPGSSIAECMKVAAVSYKENIHWLEM